MSTIPKLHLRNVPRSDLSPLELESRDERIEGIGYEVCFEGNVLGTIDAATIERNRTLRWHDVDALDEKDRKRKRESKLPVHEMSLILFDKCFSSTTPESKPRYFEDPFPFGSSSIEELAMVGGESFERTCQLYNHWFANASPMERLKREIRNFNPSTLKTDELKDAEKLLKNLWVSTHGALMKRVSGR